MIAFSNKRTLRLGVAAFSLSILSNAATANELPADLAAQEKAARLLPASPWNVNYAENKCRLSRVFGSEQDRHLLFFQQAAPTPDFEMTVAGPRVGRFANSRRLYLGLENDEALDRDNRHYPGDIPQIGAAAIYPSVVIDDFTEANRNFDGVYPISGGVDVKEAATIERIVFRRGGRVLSFETGNLEEAVKALNACTADLLREWGLDPEEHALYTPPKWENEKQVVRRIQDLYPFRALNSGEQGVVRMRVIVEKDGSVSDCYLENSTRSDRLNSPACRPMMGAQFAPALNADGAPMRSFYETSITYVLG